MNLKKSTDCYMRAIIVCLLLSLVASTAVHAQTAPTPETTFTETTVSGSDYLWTESNNWDVQVPLVTDDALIGNNQTAYYRASLEGGVDSPEFGTLTLGTSATMQYYPDSTGNAGQFGHGKSIYFNNGSHLEYTGGGNNSDHNFYILPGSTATYTPGTGNSKPRGTIQGSGDLNIIAKGNLDFRANANAFTGDLTIESNNGSIRQVSINGAGLGSGTTTFGDGVYLTTGNDDINDLGTVVLIGRGSSGYKYQAPQTAGANPSEVMGNLAIDSPSNSTPFLLTGGSSNSGGLRVTDTVTFQGTASTIEIKNLNQGYYSGAIRVDYPDIYANNLSFQGTGEWIIVGTRIEPGDGNGEEYAYGTVSVWSNGTVTVDTDVTFSNTFEAAYGFSQVGSGTLTIGDPNISGGIILSNSVLVYTTNANFSAGDYVEFIESDASFTADYGGTFNTIGDVEAAIGPTDYFRPNATATDNGSNFTVKTPPSGTVLLVK